MDYLKKVTDYLDSKSINYEVMHHEPAYTALEIAEKQHVPGRMLVKAVLVEGPEGFLLCLLPSIHNLDFEKLRAAVGIEDLKLADERDIGNLFPESELGAEPPFGYWAGLPVYADDSLENIDEIVFNGGTHTATIRITFEDYCHLENPMLVPIGVPISVSQ